MMVVVPVPVTTVINSRPRRIDRVWSERAVQASRAPPRTSPSNAANATSSGLVSSVREASTAEDEDASGSGPWTRELPPATIR